MLCGAQPARATENEQETPALQLKAYTVTANKVEEDIQDVSASVSAFDGAELDDLGVDNLRDLTLFVPNLGAQQIGTHYTEFNYRGIGGVTTMSKTWNLNVDGVTIPYAGLDTLFDVERIEVLRGGQGALYGRNTHAGVINIITRGPSEDTSVEASGSYGSFNTKRAAGSVSGPLGKNLQYRLAFQHKASDGYMQNEITGHKDTDWSDQVSGHARVYMQPTDSTDLVLSLIADTYSGPNDGWSNYDGSGDPFTSTSGNTGRDDGGLLSTALTLHHDFGSSKLTSITSYSNSRYETAVDMDLSSYDLIDLEYEEIFNTFSQELRLASTDRNARLRWLTGVFFLAEETDYTTNMTMFGVADGSTATIDTYSAAWFGQVSYDIIPCLELAVALRLEVDQLDFEWEDSDSSATYDDSNVWFAPMPSATLTYKITDDHRVYGSVSRGYRSGDYTANEVDPTVVAAGMVVDPEYTLTYELGYKGELPDYRLRFNTALFYIDWTDMQVTAVSGAKQFRRNAGAAHSYGVEADLSWFPVKGLNLFGSAGWMNAEFDEYEDHPSGDVTGNSIPNTNEYTAGFGALYKHSSGLFWGADYTVYGTKYLDELNEIKQLPYALANMKVGYDRDWWHVSLFARNMLDEEYLVRAYNVMDGVTPARYGTPRNVGVEAGFTLKF